MVSQIFKSAYAKTKPPSEGVSSPTTKKAVVDPGQSQNSAFPTIQSMKTALYFDEIEGFGEWSILLSTRAQKDLRDTKRADGATFRIVMRKIKWDLIFHRNDCC